MKDDFMESLDEKDPPCVYLLKHVASGKLFAGKRCRLPKKGSTASGADEEKIAMSVDSPFLVKVTDRFISLMDKIVVSEYCEGGTMRMFLAKKGGKRGVECECVCIVVSQLREDLFRIYFLFFLFYFQCCSSNFGRFRLS
jgi:hypothetical protein